MNMSNVRKKKCCIQDCPTKNKPPSDIVVHSFPSNPHIKSQWIAIVKAYHPLIQYTYTSYHGICSKHFPTECFHDVSIATGFTYPAKLLRKGSLPTLLLVSLNIYTFKNGNI